MKAVAGIYLAAPRATIRRAVPLACKTISPLYLSRHFMRILLVALATFLFPTGAFANLTIAQDGQARAVIITAEKPSASAQRAAQELQHFVELMTQAKLPIQTDAAAPPADRALLLVGRSRLTGGINIPAGVDREFSREGFVLKTRKNTLILAGNEDSEYHGTEFAVYELLDRLGCRWYFPGAFGQVVPSLKTIELPDLDVTQRPSFAVRNIWTSGWADVTGDMDAWLLRNKGTPRGGFAFPGDGSIEQLVPLAKYAKLFPDIYAMRKNGARQDEQTPPHMTMLCMSSDKGVELAATAICDYFRAHPEANSYGFSAPDAAAICYCPLCTARMHDFQQDTSDLESTSDPYYNFVNNLAWAVNKQFPDKYIVTLAYYTRVLPPEGLDRPWNPNIIIQLAQYRTSAIRPIGTPTDVFALRQQRTLTGWSRMAPKMLIYDYDPHADLSRMPLWRSRAIASDMRLYHQNNVVGFTTEGNNTFFRTGLNYYIRARCMWDVKANPDALTADFHRRFFGPAAAPMQQVSEGMEAMLQATPAHFSWHPFNMDWTPTYPPAQVAAMEPLLARAEKLADSPQLKQRVQMYRILHDYMTNYLRIFTLQHAGKYQEALTTLDTLPKITAAAQAIQPGLLPPDPAWVLNEGDSLVQLKTHLSALADRAGGDLGALLGRAPATAQFLPDSKNVGLFEQWQREDVGGRLKWQPIDLTRNWGLNGYRDEQGHAYEGIGWYRLAFPISKPAAGRAQLVVPLVFAEKIWVWVNGQLVCSPTNTSADPKIGPTPEQAVRVNDRGYVWLAVDIHDQLRPDAENTITFRMQGTLERTQHRGIAEIPFVWAPRK